MKNNDKTYKTIVINDDCTGRDCFAFSYEGPWVHEGGFPSRFHDGDEHWITSAQFGGNLPAFSFTFRGTAVSLFGHKTSEGALCFVELDGEHIGEIDYYAPAREEKALLFSASVPDGGLHTLRVQMLEKSNPCAGKTHEASVDYAQCVCSGEVFTPEKIEISDDFIYLERSMKAEIHARVLPEYADSTELLFSSSDPSVASVSQNGVVTGKRKGECDIKISVRGSDLSVNVKVLCSNSTRLLSAVLGDENYHSLPDEYGKLLFRCNSGYLEKGNQYRAFRRDRVIIKIDLFTHSRDADNVSIVMSDLVSNSGTIPSSCADIRLVTPTLAHDTQRYIPDCINTHFPADLKARSVYTAFALVDIPEDAAADSYKGTFTLYCDGHNKIMLRFGIRVYGCTLPEKKDYPFRLELWEYPYSAERYYSGMTTRKYFGGNINRLPFVHLTGKYDEALRSQLKLFADAGGKAITVTCVEDPWNSQTHDPYPSMIKWHRHSDGGFSFDYTDLDRWINLNFECGINRLIKTFSIACWGNRVTWINDDGSVSCESFVPGTDEWKKVWGAFLRDYMDHMLEKGWFDITYMSMDERGPEDIQALLDLNDSIKTPDGRSFRTALAVFRFDAEFLFDRIDDLSLALYMDGKKVREIAEKRRLEGKNTTLYTCGAACSALSNEPYESEYSMMFTAMRHTDGFLRWALDSFNADPIASSQHTLFAAGDLYLIYPDNPGCCSEAHTSHRFEKIAEGIRNVEKFRALAAAKPERADEIYALLDSFGHSSDIPADIRRVMDGLYAIAAE